MFIISPVGNRNGSFNPGTLTLSFTFSGYHMLHTALLDLKKTKTKRQGLFQLLFYSFAFFISLIYNKKFKKGEDEQTFSFFLFLLGLSCACPACCGHYFWDWFSFPGSSSSTGRNPGWKISSSQMLVNLKLGMLRTHTRTSTCDLIKIHLRWWTGVW